MLIIFFAIFTIQNLSPVAGKFLCNNSSGQQTFLEQIYAHQLAANDGTGALRQFICELEEQNAVIEQAFSPSFHHQAPPIVQQENENFGKNFEETPIMGKAKSLTEMFEIVEQNDPELANVFTQLRNSLYNIKGANWRAAATLANQIKQGTLLMANRIGIFSDQIMPLNTNENGVNLLTQLAKLMGQIKWKEIGKCYNKKFNAAMHCAGDSCEAERRIFQLILTAIEYEKIVECSGKNSTSKRRRRTAPGIDCDGIFVSNTVIAVLVVIGVVVAGLLSYFFGRLCCGPSLPR